MTLGSAYLVAAAREYRAAKARKAIRLAEIRLRKAEARWGKA